MAPCQDQVSHLGSGRSHRRAAAQPVVTLVDTRGLRATDHTGNLLNTGIVSHA